MEASDYHKVLLEQISKALGDSPQLPPAFQELLKVINNTYLSQDAEIKKLEGKADLRTEQLIASTSQAYSFLDSLNMGFIMCDVNGEVVLTNLSVRNILASKETVGEDSKPVDQTDRRWTIDAIDELMRPELQLKSLVRLSLSASQPAEHNEVVFGKRVLSLSIAPMLTNADKETKQLIGAVILIEDITEQKVLERSKDEFLSIASHELRTPLTAIRGNSSLIKKYFAEKLSDKMMADIVDDIHESAIRLINIVNDFLDVSSIEQGKIRLSPEIFQMNDIVVEVVRELQAMVSTKDIELVTDSELGKAPPVFADRLRVKQVVYNLVGNAIKFTEDGSITIGSRSDDEMVYVTVKDTGIGMSADSQHLLFRKFQQAGSSLLTRDTTQGTGLGLYISKLIVELSGGKIGLESAAPGLGSTFVFSLPRANVVNN